MKNERLEELKQLEQMLSSDSYYRAPINPYVLQRTKEERKERERAGIINMATGDGSLHKLTEQEKEKIIEKLATLDRNYIADNKDRSIIHHNFRVEKNIHRVSHEIMSEYARKYFLPSGTLKLFQSILEGEEEGLFVYKTKASKGIFYLDDDSTEEKEAQILKIEHDRWDEYERQQQEIEIKDLFFEMINDRALKIDYEKLICHEIFNRNWRGMSKKNQKFIIDHIRSVASDVLLSKQMQVLDEFLNEGIQFSKIRNNSQRTAQATKILLKRVAQRLNEKQ